MREKKDVSQRHEDQFLNQRALKSARRAINQLRAIVERNDAYAFWQPTLNRRDLLFDRVDYFQRIHSVTRNDYATDCFFAVLIQPTYTKSIAEFHVGDVLHVNRN